MSGFVDIKCRLDRADVHLKDLKDVVSTFVTNPETYRMWAENDPEPSFQILKARLMNRPPVSVGVLVGDCIHSLRAAMDNAIWQLSVAYKGGSKARPKPGRATGFPICTQITDYVERGLVKIECLPDAAQRYIETLQPYHRAEPALHNLAILQSLWNVDKHKTIHAAGGLFIGSAITRTYVPGGLAFSSGLSAPFNTRRAEPDYESFEGAFNFDEEYVIARYRSDMTEELEIPLGIAFERTGPGRGHAIPAFLVELHHQLSAELIPALEGFMP